MEQDRKTHKDYAEFLEERGLINKHIRRKSMPDESYDKIAEIIYNHENVENVLEIGTYCGYGTGFLNFINSGYKVITVDAIYYEGKEEILSLFDSKTFTPIISRSADYLKTADTIFDVVIIDGNHYYENCLLDWIGTEKVVKKGSVVIFDDLDSKHGCGRVFYDIDDYKKEVYEVNDRPYLGIVYI